MNKAQKDQIKHLTATDETACYVPFILSNRGFEILVSFIRNFLMCCFAPKFERLTER